MISGLTLQVISRLEVMNNFAMKVSGLDAHVNGRVSPPQPKIWLGTSTSIQPFQLTLWPLIVDHKVHIEIVRSARLANYQRGDRV